MPAFVNVGGTNKSVGKSFVKVTTNWRPVYNIFVKVGDVWKPVYSYAWETGPWSACSAPCGGGTQTRTVTCKRSDGQVMEDIYCLMAP